MSELDAIIAKVKVKGKAIQEDIERQKGLNEEAAQTRHREWEQQAQKFAHDRCLEILKLDIPESRWRISKTTDNHIYGRIPITNRLILHYSSGNGKFYMIQYNTVSMYLGAERVEEEIKDLDHFSLMVYCNSIKTDYDVLATKIGR